MWALTRPLNERRRDDLQGIATVKVNGHKFKIKKLNPLLDFAAEDIPQIFTHFSKRKDSLDPSRMTQDMIKKAITDMKRVVSAGVVDPKLCPEVLTIDDIFRWGDTGSKLYMEILAHSLNHFRGLKGVFFSIKIRRLLYTALRKNMAELQSSFSSQQGATA